GRRLQWGGGGSRSGPIAGEDRNDGTEDSKLEAWPGSSDSSALEISKPAGASLRGRPCMAFGGSVRRRAHGGTLLQVWLNQIVTLNSYHGVRDRSKVTEKSNDKENRNRLLDVDVGDSVNHCRLRKEKVHNGRKGTGGDKARICVEG